MRTEARFGLACLICLGVGLPGWGPARAEGETSSTASLEKLSWKTTLREEYIAGEPIILNFEARNEGNGPGVAADLGAQPWLVRFELQTPSGQREKRQNTAPTDPSARTVMVAPRGRRTVALEVPLSGSLKPGEYGLSVFLEGSTPPTELASGKVRIVTARPVAGDLPDYSSGADRNEAATLWLHRSEKAFDLYLHLAKPSEPGRTQADIHLQRLDQKVEPHLSLARGTDTGGRHVLWWEGTQSLRWGRLQGDSLNGLRSSTLPWPKVELAGRPATDGAGRLVAPIWVPAPKGSGGELRVLVAGERGAPSWRRAATLGQRPEVLSMVDDGGAAHFLVMGDKHADLYTVRAEEGTELPVRGKRLWSTPEGERLVTGRFVIQPGGDTAGVGVLLVGQAEGTLRPHRLSLQGKEAAGGTPVPFPEGSQILDLVVTGDGQLQVLAQNNGAVRLLESGGSQPVTGGLGVAAGLFIGDDGKTRVRVLDVGGPVRVQSLP